ncbi:hypothetical protein GF342_00950 [Candidatus Woesearchaeota archaeon]|nr:hypothetical protein [Candidatus Woesearchaeota archaeon]
MREYIMSSSVQSIIDCLDTSKRTALARLTRERFRHFGNRDIRLPHDAVLGEHPEVQGAFYALLLGYWSDRAGRSYVDHYPKGSNRLRSEYYDLVGWLRNYSLDSCTFVNGNQQGSFYLLHDRLRSDLPGISPVDPARPEEEFLRLLPADLSDDIGELRSGRVLVAEASRMLVRQAYGRVGKHIPLETFIEKYHVKRRCLGRKGTGTYRVLSQLLDGDIAQSMIRLTPEQLREQVIKIHTGTALNTSIKSRLRALQPKTPHHKS